MYRNKDGHSKAWQAKILFITKITIRQWEEKVELKVLERGEKEEEEKIRLRTEVEDGGRRDGRWSRPTRPGVAASS